uniref:Tubby C-terminal domain-containing protein n=1 Tax=Alexandrium monilatum TaxID=311494 RepID=A0A7S4PUW9_9DINO|mmetsp:Transcript_92608/g.276167  ORF Transcript_92608/g.276167 Transcript_92608/m.276167 type:complete len:272 (-) Transcript_92608:33-848(-)
MGFLEEGPIISRFFGPFGQAFRSEKKKAPCAEDIGTPKRAFDIADCMEKGLARELVSDFVQPLRDVRGLWKFDVERSADRREYRLYCAQGEFLMLAKLSKDASRIGFFLYDSVEEDCGLHDPDAPAFTMTRSASGKSWFLVQERCDDSLTPRHAGWERREVMEVVHSRQGVGAGMNHCLHVCLNRAGMNEETWLGSKLPVWNDEVRSMVLDFHGRQAIASAKNFQLALEGDPECVVCQHTKVGPNSFGLDFKCPLTVVEAFGVALTTASWV